MKNFLFLLLLCFTTNVWAQNCGTIYTVNKSADNVCASTPITFSIVNLGGGFTNIEWDFGGGWQSGASSQSHTFPRNNANQNYTVKFRAWAGTPIALYECGQTTVTIKATPTAALTTTNLLFCNTLATQTVTISDASGAPAGSTYSIAWGDGITLSSSTTAPVSVAHQFTTQGYKYIVETVTINGCSDSKTYSYYNGSNPSISMGNPGGTVDLCAPSPITFPISGFTNNSPGTVYEVYVNNVLDATYQHPPPTSYTHIFSASSCGSTSPNGSNNSYSVKIRASNPCDESLVIVEPVRISISPTANFTYTPSLCPNTPVTFTNTSTGEDVRPASCTPPAIQWALSGMQGVDWTLTSGSIAAPSSNAVTVNFLQTGTYTMCLTATSQICGTNSICKTIVVLAPAEAEAQANTSYFPNPICKDAVFNLNSNGSIGVAPLTYNWELLNSGFNTIGLPSLIWGFNGTNTASTANTAITIRQVGTYWARLTLSNTCNSDTALVKLQVIDKSTVALDPIADFCTVGNIIFTNNNTNFVDNGAITTYNWSITGGQTSTQKYPSFSNLPIGTYTVTVTATNICGSASATRAFAVIQQGAVTITLANTNTICQGIVPITLTGSPAGGVWSPNAPLGVFTPITSGSFTVNYTVSGTCSGSTSTVIVVNAQPNITVNSNPICLGNDAVLTAGGGSTYLWSTNATTAVIQVTPTVNTAYTVTGTSAGGCSAVAISNVTVNPAPIFTVTNITACNTSTAFPLGGMASSTNSAMFTFAGTHVTGSNFNAVTAGIGTHTVTVTATLGGCTKTATGIVTVSANTVANAGADQTICPISAAIDLNVQTGVTSGGVWSVAPSTTALSGNMFTPSANGAAGQTFTLTLTLGTGVCETQDTKTITVRNLPQPTATAAATCENATLGMAVSPAFANYVWTGVGGFTNNTQNPTLPNATLAMAGIYTVTVTDSNGCTNSTTVTATVNTLPVLTLTPMSICQNNNQPFGLNATATGNGAFVYSWTGTGVASPNFDASQNVGIYTVTCTVTDANTCATSGTTTVEITANILPTTVAIAPLCLNADALNLLPFGNPVGGTWTGAGVNTSSNEFVAANTLTAGTYTLTYTLNTNDPICKKSTTIDVIVKPLPNLALTSNTPCAEGTLQFTLTVNGMPAGSSYIWAGANGFTSTIQNPSITNVQSNAIGIYTVTVTGDNACTNTATNQTIVYGLPNTRSNDTAFCKTPGCYNMPFVSISDPLGTFAWSSWDAAAALSATAAPPCFTPTISGNGAWHGVVTLTDSHGCIGRDTVNIAITEPAILRLSPRIDTVCSGTNVTLHALPVGGRWYRNSIGFPDPSITNDSIVNTAMLVGGGLFHYVYSYGEGSCNVKDSVRIFVIALDTISAGANDSFCISKMPFQLIGQTPQLYTSATAHWENGHVNSAGIYTQNQGITSTGFYTPYAVAGADSSEVIIDTVKFVYTDPMRGCRIIRTKIITIHPLPVPANAIPDVGCINTLVSFVNNSPNIAVSHWEFYKPVGTLLFSVDSTDVHHVFQDTGVYHVRLEVTSAFGCKASMRDSIHIVAPPYIGFTMSHDTICAGQPITMTNASGGYEVSYIWNYGDGSVQDSVFAPPPHRFAQAECDTTYIVRLTAYNLCKTLTMTDTILIHPLPVPRWERSDDTICSGQLVSFINHTKGCNTKTYDWTIDGAPWTTDSLPPSTRFTATTIPQTYNICLHATGICGDSTLCQTIFVLPTIITAFINKDKDRGCRPLIVNFTQASGGPTAPQFTYFWDFGDGTISTLSNPAHVFDSPTRDTFRVLLLVSDGCFADTISTIVFTFPQPRLAFTNPSYQCAKQGMLFTNTSLDPISSVWIFDDGTSSAATNPVHAFANSGTHVVTLIGKSLLNGCPDTLTQNVLIRANPIITPTVSNSDGCGPLLVQFTTAGAPTGFDYYYTWNFGDGGSTVDTAHVAIAQSVEHIYAKRDTITRFEVGLTVFDQYQCKSDTLYSPIVLYPTPTADFSYTISPVCGVNAVASFTNLSTSTAGNLRYVWDFGDSRTSTDGSPTHEYISSSGKVITLTATNTYTCADSVQHRLEYCDALYIPSAFSPETGLGEVRLFGAKGIGVKQYTLSVYSRFGNLIWTADKLTNGLPVERWDGMFNGAIVPEDMYIWKCEAVFENGDIWDGQEDSAGVRQRMGTVTVLR